jgi:hypothetical protein
MQTHLKNAGLMAVAAAALLAACGGGGTSTVVATPPAGPAVVAGTDVPVDVQQSTTALVDYAKTQLAATSDKAEPVALGDAKLATSDSDEPSDI